MIQPRAIVFDLGKVLLDFDYQIAANKLAGTSDRTAQEIIGLLLHTPLLLQYETGHIDNQAFYKTFCDLAGYRGTPDEFAAAFSDIFTPIEPMIALHGELKRRGYPTFVFSNTNELAVDHIRQSYPFFANFDGYIFSFVHRCMKPEPGLYEVVEKHSGCSGPEILYLDDRAENIETGAGRGWQTIHHKDPPQTEARMRGLGLLV